MFAFVDPLSISPRLNVAPFSLPSPSSCPPFRSLTAEAFSSFNVSSHHLACRVSLFLPRLFPCYLLSFNPSWIITLSPRLSFSQQMDLFLLIAWRLTKPNPKITPSRRRRLFHLCGACLHCSQSEPHGLCVATLSQSQTESVCSGCSEMFYTAAACVELPR